MIKKHYFTLIFLSLISNSIWSQIPDNIELEGDEILYKKNNKRIEVSGNVKLSYENYNISADQFIYDLDNETISFPSKFTFKQKEEFIIGEHLNFNFKNRQGSAQNIQAYLYNLKLQGKELIINPDKFILKESYCTTCENESNYNVHSKEIQMYYLLGFLIAKKSHISINFLPFSIPVPYFIYGNNRYGLLEKTNIFPEIGTNKIEGTYLKQQLSYIINPKLSGTINQYFTNNMGPFSGGTNTWFLSKKLNTNINYLYSYKYNDIRGGINIKYLFQSTLQPPKEFNLFETLSSTFSNKAPNGYLNMSLQKLSIINDELVSYLPLYTLFLNNLSVSNKIKNTFQFQIGTIEESQNNTTLKINTMSYELDSTYTKPLNNTINLHSDSFINLHLYSKHESWARWFQSLGLSYSDNFYSKLSYNKKLINSGESPFNHEKNYALESDELELFINKTFYNLMIKHASYYNLSSQSFRKYDISVSYIQDCWIIGLGWEAIKENFYITFELI